MNDTIRINKQLLDLSTKLDELTFQYDTHEYWDNINTREEGIDNIFFDLCNEKKYIYINFLQDIINNEEYSSDEELNIINKLLKEIREVI